MDKLAVIIADMVKSALSWEEHGIHADNRKIIPRKPLTVIGVPDTLNVSEIILEEDNNDH